MMIFHKSCIHLSFGVAERKYDSRAGAACRPRPREKNWGRGQFISAFSNACRSITWYLVLSRLPFKRTGQKRDRAPAQS
ncbi:hypothetical protein [Thermocoleostomius sinensis]|uniref:Uncharacterized protein n=1 Tax=Thermocoleostomius sinensis A174 TaxID=2016057 RepID=A0A9E8ZAD3_9CYAN|nr:hypothetical protein [Thermocoleostomius sinensis]WAL58334.1 hypothetical protein OXH18_14180 [Thermocoleostomius sinensis A174]